MRSRIQRGVGVIELMIRSSYRHHFSLECQTPGKPFPSVCQTSLQVEKRASFNATNEDVVVNYVLPCTNEMKGSSLRLNFDIGVTSYENCGSENFF